MKLPRLVITTFAKKCHLKVVDIKEYVTSHHSLTNAVQLRRLESMNLFLNAQWQRMRKAWNNHDSIIDTVNGDCLLELADIVTQTGAEVKEIY